MTHRLTHRVVITALVCAGSLAIRSIASGQSHGFDVGLECNSPVEPLESLSCETLVLHEDSFGDTMRVEEAFLIVNPGPDAIRVPATGNSAVLTILGNARYAGVPGQLPVILGEGNSILNGLPGDPDPGVVILLEEQYVIAGLDPSPLIVQAGVTVVDQCDNPDTEGCASLPDSVLISSSVVIADGDCNGNQIGDSVDIAMGTSDDCNANAIPDECDQDSNDDGVIDDCDCNDNGVLDADDIDMGTSADVDRNDIPDECESDFVGPAHWVAPTGGLFRHAANWNPDAPGPGNEAVFDLDATYVVDFDLDAMVSGATISAGDVTFALAPGLRGGGPPPELIVDGNVCVGCFGDGILRIVDGASVFCRDATIGQLAGSTGLIELTGAGSLLTAPFFVIVDRGSLEVGLGATVSAGFDQFGGIFLLGNGTLRGDGTIDATVVNFGHLAPGTGAGPLLVDGGYIQVGVVPDLGPSSGTLELVLDAPGAPAPMQVLGEAELGGGLFVDVAPGADPQAGESFAIIDATTVTERFDVALFPGIDGRVLRVQYPDPFETAGSSTVTIDVESFVSLLGFDDPANASISGQPVDIVVTQLDDEPGSPVDLAIVLPDPDPLAPGTLLVLFDVVLNGNAVTIGDQVNVTVGVRPTAVAAGDLDGNGIADLVVSDGGDDDVRVLLTQPDRTLTLDAVVPVGDDPRDVAIADFSGDTFLDVVVANYEDQTVQQFFNDGGGTLLSSGVIITPGRVIAIDPETVDDDKDIDAIVVIQDANSAVALVNGGGGQGLAGIAAVLPVGEGPVDVIVADLDGQETAPGEFLPEIITLDADGGTVSILINNGGFSFEPAVSLPVGATPASFAAIDLDQDGDVELAVVTSSDEKTPQRVIKVLRNDTDGGTQLILADAETFDFGDDPVLVAGGDLDGDTDADLIAINEAVGGGTPFAGPADTTLNAVPNTLFAPPCPGDTNGDGVVNVDDLNNVILDWGTDGSANGGDITGAMPGSPPDGIVNVNDLNAVVVGWGDCP